MKTFIILTFSFYVSAFAGATPAEDAFNQLKKLAGTWTVNDGDEISTIEYEIASGGTSVIKKYKGMVTVHRSEQFKARQRAYLRSEIQLGH